MYLLRYNLILLLIGSIKLAITSKSIIAFCHCIIGYINSWINKEKYIVNSEIGKFIRNHRYNNILKKNPKLACVVGLTTEPKRLVDIRKNRMNSLKESENRKYTSLENIKKEINEAKKTFQKYRWPTIDVTRKSVEEAAASIIKIHEI